MTTEADKANKIAAPCSMTKSSFFTTPTPAGMNIRDRWPSRLRPVCLNCIVLQWAPPEGGEVIASQEKQQQERHAEHRSGHRQPDTAHNCFAHQLAEQNQAETCDHARRSTVAKLGSIRLA
ncbi:hypothetical protein ABIA09_000104 [Bradyrhizobium yuanmingense]